MKEFHRIIYKPLVTEKGQDSLETNNKYTFEVSPDANKVEIRQAIEAVFSLKNKVLKVNTSNINGKYKRKGRIGGYRRDRKKAVVTLVKGATIAGISDTV
jgi:large subunit ribosomal protein L23